MFDEQQEVWYGWFQIEGMTLMEMKMVYKRARFRRTYSSCWDVWGSSNQKVDGVWKFEEKSRDDEGPNECTPTTTSSRPAAFPLWQISMWASELFWRGHWQRRCETELDRKVADSSHGGSSRLRAGMLPCAGRSRFASLSKPPRAQSRWKSPLSLPVMKAPTH